MCEPPHSMLEWKERRLDPSFHSYIAVGSSHVCYKGWRLHMQELEASSDALLPYWGVTAD